MSDLPRAPVPAPAPPYVIHYQLRPARNTVPCSSWHQWDGTLETPKQAAAAVESILRKHDRTILIALTVSPIAAELAKPRPD